MKCQLAQLTCRSACHTQISDGDEGLEYAIVAGLEYSNKGTEGSNIRTGRTSLIKRGTENSNDRTGRGEPKQSNGERLK